MSWRISRDTEEAVWRAARARLPEATLKHKLLVPAILARSAYYNGERDDPDLVIDTRSAADLAARAVFFSLADAAKIKVPLAELANRGALALDRQLVVLDVGAGCGAMALGLAEGCGAGFRVHALDRDRAALELMAASIAELGRAELEVTTEVGDAGAFGGGPFDLVVVGSVLNEISEARGAELCARLIASLTEDGALIIVEPALKETSRRLHRLRDGIINGGHAHIFAPCTRRAAPCPSLAEERDWCHEDRPFELTPRLAALSRATGLRAQRLKFSYLVVTRRDLALSPVPGLLRIVSSLRKSKGQSELYACGEDGRDKLRLQKRDRNVKTRIFERARRGQLLEVGEDSFALHDPSAEEPTA